MGWHQFGLHLIGLSHPMLGICSHGNDRQIDITEIEVTRKKEYCFN